MTSANTVVPSDILFEIIDNLEDRDASVFLLVSRQLRIYTLRRLYQSISFNPFAAPSPISLKRLCDNIVSNQGIQFTTAFDFWYPSAFQGSDVHARIAQILPYLSNVQRLAISSTYGITLPPEILRSLSPTARLTHLILDRVVYSEDFIHFLEASPTLQSISIYSFSSFWIDSDEFPPSVLEDPYTQALQREFDQLSSDALPHLRSLAIPIQSPLFGYRPALRDLGLRIGWSEPEFQVQVIVDALTLHPGSAGGCALRTLFVRGAAFASVVNLASQIPSLEYLSFQAAPLPDIPTASALLLLLRPLTKLKYIRIDESQYRAEGRSSVACTLFDIIQSLQIVDIGEVHGLHSIVRRFRRPLPVRSDANKHPAAIATPTAVQLPYSRWRSWWEDVENAETYE